MLLLSKSKWKLAMMEFCFSCARFSWVHYVVYFLCTLGCFMLFIILLFTYICIKNYLSSKALNLSIYFVELTCPAQMLLMAELNRESGLLWEGLQLNRRIPW
jgi:hypothetical protein